MQELGAHPLLIAILYFCISLCLFKGNPLCLKQCPALCNTRRLPIPHIVCAFRNDFFCLGKTKRWEKQKQCNNNYPNTSRYVFKREQRLLRLRLAMTDTANNCKNISHISPQYCLRTGKRYSIFY